MRGRGIIYVTSEEYGSLCRYMEGPSVITKKIPRADYIFEILGRVNEYKKPYYPSRSEENAIYGTRV